MNRMGTRIAGFGHHAPDQVVTSAEIERRLGLAEGWIAGRTGIHARRVAAPHEAVSDLAVAAADMALADAALPKGAVGLTLLATSTPDHLLPPTAPLLAHRLGLTSSGAVDLTGACAGFLYALVLADGFVRTTGRVALVAAANILSRRTDPRDAATAALFADAAGAIVLAPSPRADAGVIASSLASDGSAYDLIQIPDSGSRLSASGLTSGDARMVMRDGRTVFSRAVAMMASSCRTALEDAGLAPEDVIHFLPHQANARIITAVAERLGIGPERTLSSVADFGNSSAATLPFTLSALRATRAYGEGDVLLLTAAGAGLTGGAAVFRF
ncbi:beta-ketoacyl-ACP synthase III [Xanthobacter autotrophicus]|uniref:beta-ketoacyl-ACP synthase III n=2 Tax=Xanthobacter TaxID=279 RepID=UPI0024ADC030|nr:beta-ketoacyl-ACP synthase III [Xanthobacter autotrophicus]